MTPKRSGVSNTHKLGGLEVTKSVDWKGVTPDTAKTFSICITGPSYATANCKSATYNGGTLTWSNLIPGDYTVSETNPGTEWTVSIDDDTPTVIAGDTEEVGVSNTHKLGGLEITKSVDWKGVTPDTAKTFSICITGPSYATANCKSATTTVQSSPGPT